MCHAGAYRGAVRSESHFNSDSGELRQAAGRRTFSAAPNGERERATGFTFSVLGGETVLGRNRFRSTVCKGMAFYRSTPLVRF
jgi:hypothetical protein